MAKTSKDYPEMENIKEDIESLKENTIQLGKHIKKDGAEKTKELTGVLAERLSSLSETSQDQLKHIEKRVKEKPLQSVAVAFIAGLAASILLGRR